MKRKSGKLAWEPHFSAVFFDFATFFRDGQTVQMFGKIWWISPQWCVFRVSWEYAEYPLRFRISPMKKGNRFRNPRWCDTPSFRRFLEVPKCSKCRCGVCFYFSISQTMNADWRLTWSLLGLLLEDELSKLFCTSMAIPGSKFHRVTCRSENHISIEIG